jgi:DNA polymerase IV (DinB-like DNA polymerase)
MNKTFIKQNTQSLHKSFADLIMPIILHVDLDAFYASVEERERLELKGKPVVVGADPKGGAGRGVVSTCNYEARKYGIRSGMPISVAYRKCPQCVFLPVQMGLYVAVSQEVMKILQKYAEKIEQVSIDEAYLDVSWLKSYEKARELAQKIKDDIKTKEKLTCSIGIGPNKLIAKVASDFKKPDGLTVVPPEKVLDFLAPQDIDILRGVGPKTKFALNKIGIKTVKEARKFSKAQLVQLLGRFGESLYEQCHGIAPAELVTEWTQKSMGRNHTFEHDTKNKDEILAILDKMCQDIWKQLKEEKSLFKTVTLRVRYEDFETHTSQKTLLAHTNSTDAVRNTAKELLKPFLKDARKIRLVGVSVGKLERQEPPVNRPAA